MKIENFEEKTLKGLSLRTTNKDEMNASTAKIGHLWQKFNETVSVDYQNNNHIYGVYYDYESDANGAFSVLAGTDQTNIDSGQALESITIPQGKYLVFEAMGEMLQIVVETWKKVWDYFAQEDCAYARLFTTDFEYYADKNKIKIYIAVKES
jgi:predicted transcriptional regulator YdeE